MRRVILATGLALLVGVLLPGGAGSAVGGSDLPYKGVLAGSFTLDPVTGQTHVVGSGQVTHLGRTALDEHQQLVPTGPDTFLVYATVTLTAANGDQLVETGVGTGIFTDATHATIVSDYASTAGSGRFAAGSSTASATVHVTLLSADGGTWELTTEGRLSYR